MDRENKQNKLNITKIFNFEAAHALENYDGLCANIHGHSYKLDVCVQSRKNLGSTFIKDEECCKNGMILDFGMLKKYVNDCIIDDFDHALMFNENSNKEVIEVLKKHKYKIIVLPFQPTSENLLIEFAQRLKKALPEDIKLKKLRLYETASSFTEWVE